MVKRVKQKVASDDSSPKSGGVRLTTPDLVILSLLAERPMHGYEVNATLEEREIREWAPVSRPQIYYSLEKLVRLGLIRVTAEDQPSAGPERRVVETTAAGRDQLAGALEASHWSTTRVHQPFLIWMALSWQARRGIFDRQVKRRRQFLNEQLADQKSTLADVLKDVGHPFHEAVWMLKLTIAETETELRWLDTVTIESAKRAPARR